MDRKLELESNLHDVQAQIRQACIAANRDFSDVTGHDNPNDTC